jgi:hypothetical protein
VESIVQDALNGINGTVMAYGQTGAGMRTRQLPSALLVLFDCIAYARAHAAYRQDNDDSRHARGAGRYASRYVLLTYQRDGLF